MKESRTARAEKLAEEKLSEKRFEHSRAVAIQAVRLAEIYNEDTEKAEYAGWMHDICKEEPGELLLKRISDSGIILNQLYLHSPKVWHGIAASAFLKTELNCEDADILNAVRYHTTGRAKMSPLEKIIYIADLTSSDRSYPDVSEVRHMAETSLDSAMRYALGYIIKDLAQKGRPIVNDTFEAYNEYVLGEVSL